MKLLSYYRSEVAIELTTSELEEILSAMQVADQENMLSDDGSLLRKKLSLVEGLLELPDA